MSQPLSVSQTFDASLVDLQKSFSSTDTNTSGASAKENFIPTMHQVGRSPSPCSSVSTETLYNQWATTYDHDGNVMQAIDDTQLHELLPAFVQLASQTSAASNDRSHGLKILDLGCGTGRNTVKLLQSSWHGPVDISGWDGSQAMLEVARTKCEAAVAHRQNVGIELEQVDISRLENVPARFANHFDGLISTLVLEHIPIEIFFGILAKVLKPGAYALVTNMHENMGKLSRAGYKTASGERVKATSYIYSVPETLEAAANAGLSVIGDPKEAAVDEQMIDGGVVRGVKFEKGQVTERARKWVGTTIWYGLLLQKK